MGTESEVSSAICYLLSEAAAFVSGVTLRIDGAASQGTRMYPLADAKNSQSYNGFHRAFIPDVLKSQAVQPEESKNVASDEADEQKNDATQTSEANRS